LYFGRNIGTELGVSDMAWSEFVSEEISPRFPDGLTIGDAEGQWRDRETGVVIREPSKELIVFLDDEASDRARLAEIIQAYKLQFQQQAVVMVIERSCVSFE
jgi:hypothetical protein